MTMRSIVVGVDGSEGSRAALRWAAEEARLHDASVTALLVWSLLRQPGETFTPTFNEGDARTALEALVSGAALPVEILCTTVCDLPAAALVEASASADLVVVGSRGLGGFKELLLGSVSATVAERASSPVAVVRETGQPGGPVVVGVDGSFYSDRAVRWAAEEARARGASLEVVHAWSVGAPVLGVPFVVPHDEAELAAEHRLAAATEDVDLSGITVNRHLVAGGPAGVLVDLSKTAGVVVVGSRGRGGITSILLGSTSRHLLHHAVSPVVVIR